MATKQAEGDLSRKIVQWLNKQPHTIARKRHVSVYGVRGDPDIYACVYGRHFEMETKIPPNTSTPNQQLRQQEWIRAYSPFREVYSLKDAQTFYYEILATIPDRDK